MELRRYAQVLRRRWGIAVIGFLVTMVGAIAFVMPQPWIYESTAKLVVVPRDGLTVDELSRATEGIGNPAIAGTFAEAAGGSRIEDEAKLRLTEEMDTSDVEIDAIVVIDTAAIEIIVTDPDPEVAFQMASATVAAMEDYADKPTSLFRLESLEDPEPVADPTGPNKMLMLAAGFMLAVALAIGLALLAEYLRRPAEELAVDDPITGLRNELYLRERLHEEMARTKRTDHTTAICMVRVAVRSGENEDIAHAPSPQDMRRIARGLRLTVSEDAVLASLAGGIFVVLLPDAQRAKADALRDGWVAAIRALLDWASQGTLGPALEITGGTGEISNGQLVATSEVENALRVLAGADLVTADTDRRSVPRVPEERHPRPARVKTPAKAEGTTTTARPAASGRPAARIAGPRPSGTPARAQGSGAQQQTTGGGRSPERTAPEPLGQPQPPKPTSEPTVVIPEMPPAPRQPQAPAIHAVAARAEPAVPREQAASTAEPAVPREQAASTAEPAAPREQAPANGAPAAERSNEASEQERSNDAPAEERSNDASAQEPSNEATAQERSNDASAQERSNDASAQERSNGAATGTSRRRKRNRPAATADAGAAATNGDEAAPAKDPMTVSESRDGGGGSSREAREETSRAGDRSG